MRFFFFTAVLCVGSVGTGCRPEPAALEIVPQEIAVAPGSTAMVHVIARDASGAEVAASLERPLAIDVAWSATGNAATVEARAQERAWRPEAIVKGAAAGEGEIVATCCGGKTARAKVRVVAPTGAP